MTDLKMKPTDKTLYEKYETKVLNKVELGILSMYEAAKLIDNYLKSLGY